MLTLLFILGAVLSPEVSVHMVAQAQAQGGMARQRRHLREPALRKTKQKQNTSSQHY